MDFKAAYELWNQLNEAVLGTFRGSGGHGKRNLLQDRASFHRSRECQSVLMLTLHYVLRLILIGALDKKLVNC